MVSKNFDKRGPRSNVIKRVCPVCSYAHIFQDGDSII